MKVIINVHKLSMFAKHNGKTFDAQITNRNYITANINGVDTDLTIKEVMIVDFDNVFNTIAGVAAIVPNDRNIREMSVLKEYIAYHNIQTSN